MLPYEKDDPILESAAYSFAVAASYTRVPYQTLRYWAAGKSTAPLISLPDENQPALSFLNLLECHVLNALRTKHQLNIKIVRRALEVLTRIRPSKHPLLDKSLVTDNVDLFLAETDQVVNLSQGGQTEIKDVLQTYLQRIAYSESGIPKFFPFVLKDRADEPKIVSILPTVAFGRSVIDGTGITTAVIAARFQAREPISALAKEYGRSDEEIQEAIIWETNRTAKAA